MLKSDFCPKNFWRNPEDRKNHTISQSNIQVICLPMMPVLAIQDALYKTPVQTTGADGFKLALINVSEKLNSLDARIVHTQHDETIVAARDAVVDQVQTIVKESMEAAFRQFIPKVPFVVEPKIADS
jgi:hypothetical protein